jgi:hypothetical protein
MVTRRNETKKNGNAIIIKESLQRPLNDEAIAGFERTHG